MTAALLQVSNLEVRYGDLVGVADVSLEVPRGSIVALLGSNGAGKTSTLNAIAGLVAPTRGTITLEDRAIAGEPAYAMVRKGLALSPEGWRLFVQQTVENNLLLGATSLADRRSGRCSSGSIPCFPNSPSGDASGRAPCRGASGRCSRSDGR
jgi:branched-chain amino acid transport system ATP-binding protein